MRILSAVPSRAKRSVPTDGNGLSPEAIVCSALTLALLFLAWRIASVYW